ncbi:MAG TPA: long-chain fatty acid--CoA ligase [Dehalococcoidia bacterium]|jgi:long-chain acyl-CoA synthetase|nr:long-chain fatty acid--CoA ligase [Dehalococcoidia bacterium]
MNLKSMLEETVGRYPEKAAVICGERKLSYAELDEASNKVAGALLGMGVEKGDRVAMLMSNSPEFVIIYFGIIKAGGIAVPLDVKYKVAELTSLFHSCQPKVLVAESECLEPLITALPRFGSIEHVIDLDGRYEGRFLSYGKIMATSPSREVEVTLGPDDIGTVSYTGGPSSRPRGAALSHRSLVTEAIASGEGFQQTDRDVVMLFALPLYHMFGLASALLTSVCYGSTVVMVPGTGRSIVSFLETIERERGTIYLGVPYIYALAINVAEREGINCDLSSVRLWCSGGATLTDEIREHFRQCYHADILDIWGLTESVSHVTHHPLDGTTKLNSTGKALSCWEIRTADDDGNLLPPNQLGEIVVRGPIMKGYYNDPQATAEVIRNGWLHTGDLGRVDEDGYLFLSGLKKDMIILKGQNVYPLDIEEVLCSYYKVARAVVVGIPDKLRGEIVGAIVKLKEKFTATEQEIRSFCQTRLADYKIPKKVIFTKSLLESAKTGKKKIEDYLPDLSVLFSSSQREEEF